MLSFRQMFSSRWAVAAVIPVIGLLALAPLFEQTATAIAQAERRIVQPPLKSDVARFMKEKLSAVHGAMDGMATDDYAHVADSAQKLVELSQQAAWKQRANAGYLQDTADFVDAAEFLVRMAEAKDSQGVAAAYAQLSVSCTNCHRHVRGPKLAAVDDATPFVAAR